MLARTQFTDEADKRAYVQACDADFEARLDAVVKEIIETPNLRYLTLSGPTCSGKTTAAKKLVSEFAERGKRVREISLDNFFRSRAELTAEAEREGRGLDFDSERALDLPLLQTFIDCIKAGKPAPIPHFDFTSGCVTSSELFSNKDADILIFEGIQAMYPVFTEMLKGLPFLSLIIHVAQNLTVGENMLTPRTVRLLRRLVRDERFRGASPEFTFRLWETVTENEDKNILPFIGNADLQIDSVLGYEACMLKPYAVPLLSSLSPSSPYYEKAQMLLAIFEGVDTISESYIPAGGLYREFL